METSRLIRRARHRAQLTQRELAARAATSHATLAAYETGAKVPRVDTLDRILQAAGYVPEVELRARPDTTHAAREAKGRELLEALELAAAFPARRRSAHLVPPVLRAPEARPS
jgi:transcriptional regulator with XRE-family HTH domain